MTLFYNIEPYVADLVFIQGDTINMTFSVTQNDLSYIMTGMQLDITFKRMDGKIVKQLSSAGGAPAIIILLDTFTIYTAGFNESGTFKYDVQVTDGADIETIMTGNALVKKEYTT